MDDILKWIVVTPWERNVRVGLAIVPEEHKLFLRLRNSAGITWRPILNEPTPCTGFYDIDQSVHGEVLIEQGRYDEGKKFVYKILGLTDRSVITDHHAA